MIAVQNLTKIYKSRDKRSFKALKEISFTLPDCGMVFVLGKSGSGKSTLLNLLGGLDSFEGGEIVFENAKLSSFSQQDFYAYRRQHIGFVFQDYHLLEELTVAENVALALDLAGEPYDDRVSTALRQVGMEGYESRHPKELSGGQQQRVAMARAIVKNPSVVLCDEPTGNLDAETSKQILDLLKEISCTRLVMIVSHNLYDAETYGDRLLELSEGRLVKDVTKEEFYRNTFSVEDGVLSLPYNRNLTEEQIGEMVDGIRTGSVRQVVQKDNGFHTTGQVPHSAREYEHKNAKMSARNILRFTKTLMRNKFLQFFLTALTATLIVSCFAVFQSFLHYDGNEALAQSLVESNIAALAYQKSRPDIGTGVMDTNHLLHVGEDEIQAFRDPGYTGKIYKLYDHAMVLLPGTGDSIGAKRGRNAARNVISFYLCETYGVLACDKELLTELFGTDGEITVLAGDLSQPNRGIIITDYIADSIIYGNPTVYPDYQSIIGAYQSVNKTQYGVIDAIIETEYEEQYGALKDRLLDIRQHSDHAEEEFSALAITEEFMHFAEQVQLFLGIGYTFSENYPEDMSTDIAFLEWGIPSILTFDAGLGELSHTSTPRLAPHTKYTKEIEAGSIVMPYTVFNSIAGTAYTTKDLKEFVPTEITMYVYAYDNTCIGSRTFTVSELSTRSYIYLNEADLLEMRPILTSPYALYFDDITQAEAINLVANARDYVVHNIESANSERLTKLITTFAELFQLFEAFLLVICVVYLAIFGSNVIQKNKYQIGVIKALGGKTNQIARIYVAQLLLVGLLIFALSGFAIWVATGVANDILIDSVREHMGIYIYHLRVIDFVPELVAIDMVLVLLITVLSSLVPLIAVHRIKPINIIKAKE